MMKLSEKLANRINKLPDGSTFMASSFIDIAKKTTVNRMLLRLANKGVIRKIGYGIYEKPVYSEILKEYADTNFMNVANTISKNYNWIIVPSGNMVLNMIHLSTQVPNNIEYISSGPYRNFIFGKKRLVFKSCANKNIYNKSQKTLLLIQALKAIGKDKIEPNDITTIKKYFTKSDIIKAVKETNYSTYWIYETIKNIAEV